MNCDYIQELRFDLADGTLDAVQENTVAKHLRHCRTCREVYDCEANHLRDQLHEEAQEHTLSDARRAAICAAARATKKPRSLHGAWIAGLAASLLLIFWWTTRSPESIPQQITAQTNEPLATDHVPTAYIVARATEYTDASQQTWKERRLIAYRQNGSEGTIHITAHNTAL